MKILKYILLLPVTILALYSEAISSYLIELGLSWTVSKWWVYIVLWLLPVFYIVLMIRAQKKDNSLLMPIMCFVVSTSIAAFHFYTYPVYDGDISNPSTDIQNMTTIDGFENGLLMISIPGCPYCFEATETLKTLKQRVPALNIRQIVLSDRVSDIEAYDEVSGQYYKVDTSSAYSFYSGITSSYPTFVLVKNGEVLKKWSNSGFGVLARDEIEASVD